MRVVGQRIQEQVRKPVSCQVNVQRYAPREDKAPRIHAARLRFSRQGVNGSPACACQPLERDVNFQFRDQSPSPGESYYYVRVIQVDDQMAWSSPIWIRRP